MRSVSAALNRVFLAFFGLIIVCASAWFLASGLDAGHWVPSIAAYLATTQDEIGAFLSPHALSLIHIFRGADISAPSNAPSSSSKNAFN